MANINCHSDQHFYPVGTKTIGFIALEEMSFKNFDGRTTDAWLYYKLTYEPSTQVS